MDGIALLAHIKRSCAFKISYRKKTAYLIVEIFTGGNFHHL